MTIFRIHDSPLQASSDSIIRLRGKLHFLLGIVLLAIAVVGLRRDISWIAQPFYAWVWWGYIFVLDGFCAWKRADSLLTRRLRFLIPIAIWSTTFWFFFELLNVRMQNWYYVGVFPAEQELASAFFTLFAFATVFMGIFQTCDALSAAGLWKNWKGKERRYPKKLSYIIQIVGLVMGGLALIYPTYLAPLIWGSFTFVVDPWNYRRGARSLLRDFEVGDFGLIARLLTAGLICGVVWESLNFFAPQKWIYTVRGLEGFKLFEMPLLGFLGFPALALDATAGFALLSSIFLGNRSWERDEDLSYALEIRKPLPAIFFWASIPAQLAFCGFVYVVGTPTSIASIQLEISHLGLSPAEQARLESEGVRRPRQLLKFEAEDLGWEERRFSRIHDRVRLYTFKGIGVHHGRLLESVGIRTPEDLRGREPEELFNELVKRGTPFGLRLDFVKVWILAARDGGVIVGNRSS